MAATTVTERIREELLELADLKLRDFSSKLIPGCGAMLGVRLPLLRKIARRIAANGEWQEFLADAPTACFEEKVLQGMTIGCLRIPIDQRLALAAAFLPRIDNWAVCDSFCSGFHIGRGETEAIWNFTVSCFRSAEPYTLRTGVVMLLSHFIAHPWLEEAFRLLEGVRHEDYYVRMGVAWALSICFVRYPAATLARLENSPLDNWTYNKTLQKICESRRVDPDTKRRIRQMKRRP